MHLRRDIKQNCIDTTRKILFKQIGMVDKIHELNGIESEVNLEEEKLENAHVAL